MTVAPADEAARGAAGDSVTFSFAAAGAELYGVARLGLVAAEGGLRGSSLAVLFAGREPVAVLARGDHVVGTGADWASLALPGLAATVEEPLARWRVRFDAEGGDGFDLEFAATGAPAELAEGDAVVRAGGMAGYDQPCHVRGTVRARGRERRVDCLGQRDHAWGSPAWDRIELARSVSAWTDGGPSAAVVAVRPAGARHHAEEAVWGALWEPSGPVPLDEARLSTTYDAEGRTRRAGLELWPEGDDGWARRGAGEVLCGSSLDLGALRLDCAFFRWHLEGREGVGRYDVLRRA